MPPRKRRATSSSQKKSNKAVSTERHRVQNEKDSSSRGRISQEPSTSSLRADEELKEVENMEILDHIPAPPLKRKNTNKSQENCAKQEVANVDTQKESELERRRKTLDSLLRETDLANFASTTILAARFTQKLVRRISLEGLLKFRCRQDSISDDLKRHIFDVSFNKEAETNKCNLVTSEQIGKHLNQGSVRSGSSNHSNTRNLSCSHCGTLVSSSRYAAHLEKCLGKGGRLSSRAASLRLRNSASEGDQNTTEDSI